MFGRRRSDVKNDRYYMPASPRFAADGLHGPRPCNATELDHAETGAVPPAVIVPAVHTRPLFVPERDAMVEGSCCPSAARILSPDQGRHRDANLLVRRYAK